MRMGISETRHGAGHADRQPAVARSMGIREPLRVEEDVRRGRGGRGLPIIECDCLLLFREADQHEAAAAEIAGAG